MKKTILTTIFVSLFIGVSAQWNNTGDSKTTGSLTVGNDANNTYSHLTILGPNSPLGVDSKRDIVFKHKDAGQAIIRSNRTGGWGNELHFLTTKASYLPELRMAFNVDNSVTFYDKEIHLGEAISGKLGESPRLMFSGTDYGYGMPYISKYARTTSEQDLRISLGGNEHRNRFIVGRSGANDTYVPLFHIYSNGNVGIGLTDAKVPLFKLEVNGTIRAKEVRVETGWADFVFKDDYKLPTLQEVKAHIDAHKHLPGMPSEAEVQENGVGLADATTKLLQKVEELTLYAIQQQELIAKLAKEVDDLKNSQN